MDDTLINQGFLWFFGALFVGPLAGWLVHFVGGFERGVAVGCLVIGLTGSTMAVLVGFDRARQLEGMVAVEGRLVEPNYPAAFAYLAAHNRKRALKVLFTGRDRPDGERRPGGEANHAAGAG